MNLEPSCTGNSVKISLRASNQATVGSQIDEDVQSTYLRVRALFYLVLLSSSLLWLCLLLAGCSNDEPSRALAAPLPTTTISVDQQSTTGINTVTNAEPFTGTLESSAVASLPTGCPNRSLVDSNEIVIGVLLPVFGNKALIGQSMQAGFNIATHAINQAGGIAGKPLRLALHDTMESAQLGQSGAEYLIGNACAVALIGVHKTDIALAVSDVAHQHGVPLIVIDAYGDKVTGNGYPEVFRIGPSTTQYFQQAAKWVTTVGDYNGDGTISSVVIAEDSEHGQIHSKFHQQAMAAEGIQSKDIYVKLPMSDFSPVIARIVEMENAVDVIFIRIAGEPGLQLQKQLLNSGITPQNKTLLVMPQAALDTTNYWQLMGRDGVLAIATRVGAWPNTVGDMGFELAKQYRAYQDTWPDHHVFSSHDAIYLIADAIQRSQSLSGSDLIQALEQTDIHLAAGHYSFPIGSAQLQAEVTSSGTMSESVAPQPDWRWHQWLDAPVLYFQYTMPYQDSTKTAVLWPPAYKTVEDAFIKP